MYANKSVITAGEFLETSWLSVVKLLPHPACSWGPRAYQPGIRDHSRRVLPELLAMPNDIAASPDVLMPISNKSVITAGELLQSCQLCLSKSLPQPASAGGPHAY